MLPLAVLVVGGANGGGEEVGTSVVVVVAGGLKGDGGVGLAAVVSVEDFSAGMVPGSKRGMYMLYTNEPGKKISNGEVNKRIKL